MEPPISKLMPVAHYRDPFQLDEQLPSLHTLLSTYAYLSSAIPLHNLFHRASYRGTTLHRPGRHRD